MAMRTLADRRQRGFTLIELLIVISIIAVLAMLTTAMVGVAKKKAREAAVKSDINAFAVALSSFRSDEGYLPGQGKKWDESDEYFNAFPDLFEAILGQPRSKGGKGGRGAPYWEEYKVENIAVLVDEDDPTAGHREADREEATDPSVRKFYLDGFGRAYIYRENKSKKAQKWMWKPGSYDLWSVGANGKNESMWADDQAAMDESDDIGSWK